MKLLEGRVAVITGAGRGWGQSIAIKFAEQGAKVIVVSRTKSELNQTLEKIKEIDGIGEGISIDISDDASLLSLMDHIDNTYGKLDILINNAAILPLKEFLDFSVKEIDEIININLRAQVVLCKLSFDYLRRAGGASIVNVSSSAGILGFEKETIYCASKHAIEGFTKALALEWAQYKIVANTITPGGRKSNIRIKPTSLTQKEFENLPELEKNLYTDSIVSSDAFVFLALQRQQGITGKRFLAYELSEHIRKDGWNLSETDLLFDEEMVGWY